MDPGEEGQLTPARHAHYGKWRRCGSGLVVEPPRGPRYDLDVDVAELVRQTRHPEVREGEHGVPVFSERGSPRRRRSQTSARSAERDDARMGSARARAHEEPDNAGLVDGLNG